MEDWKHCPQFAPLADLIRSHGSFAVIAHVHPDGDAIGSTLALGCLLYTSPLFQAADKASANQISGDDKEDVHACIAPRTDPFLQMVQGDGQHGKGTQAVNVREIGSVDGVSGLVGRR